MVDEEQRKSWSCHTPKKVEPTLLRAGAAGLDGLTTALAYLPQGRHSPKQWMDHPTKPTLSLVEFFY